MLKTLTPLSHTWLETELVTVYWSVNNSLIISSLWLRPVTQVRQHDTEPTNTAVIHQSFLNISYISLECVCVCVCVCVRVYFHV